MHIKGKQLGRKLSTKMVVAEEERQRRKEVKQNRKYYKTKIRRAKIRKRLMRQDNFLEDSIMVDVVTEIIQNNENQSIKAASIREYSPDFDIMIFLERSVLCTSKENN